MMRVTGLCSRRSVWKLTFVAACFALFGAGPASAETFHATSTQTLEEAVAEANANGVANTIELAGGHTYLPSRTMVFTNTSGAQTVTGPVGTLGVDGPEAKLEGSDVEPVTGISEKELITVKAGVSVTIEHLVVTTGGTSVNAAIEDFGTLRLEDSTISGNTGNGVVVQPEAGLATFTNSTISNGLADGVVNHEGASFVNDTVVQNKGTGIGGEGTLILTNTILANNGSTGVKNCEVAATTSDHSLDNGTSCGVGALSSTAPKLGALLNDGGSTSVYSEQPGSPSIDAGDAAACPATDQRGYPRPAAGSTGCDIGSDEYSPTPPSITVPKEIVTPATGPSGAAVSYVVEASDSDGLVRSLTCTPTSGSTFPAGTTKVECTAVDGHENTAKASFNVTVTTAVCAASPAVGTQPSNQTVTEPAGASFTIKEGTVPTNCSPATIQWELSTNGGTSFTPITGATGATYTINPTHASETGDELRAVLTNTHGKTTSTTATLTINTAACTASPTVGTQPSNQTVTEPAGASFTIKEGTVPTNCSPATIQWELSTNGGTSFTPITGATGATYTINPTHASETGDELRAVLTNTHGKTTSTTATLTINTAACTASPTVGTQPSNQTVTEPAGASFTIKEGTVPTNCSPATIQWELSTNGGTSFTPITGATGATYTINPTHASETGDELRAVLTNTHGKTTSTTATLTINTAACTASPTVGTQPSNQTVTEPAGASFTIKEGTVPTNCSPATIQWELSTNGGTSFTPITGATGATYTINPTHASETGDELRAVLTNTHGKTTSTTATLTINTAACTASPTVGTQPSNQTVTEPAGASFTIKEGTVPTNCSPATIQWELSTNGGTSFTPITGATGATYTINPTHASETGDELRAVLTNTHGKTTSTTATLTINTAACTASPTVGTQPSNQTVTEPAGASFTIKEGTVPTNCSPATIQWELSTNGGTSFTPITGATGATYTINPTHASETGDELRAVLTNTHGKTTSTTATLTINTAATSTEAAIHQLLQEVSSSAIPNGIRHKLSCLLSRALHSLVGPSGYGHSKCGTGFLSSRAATAKADRWKSTRSGACEDLEQFIDVIGNDQHRTKPKIPAKLATTWSRAAYDIEASLGCMRDGRQSSRKSGRPVHEQHRGHRSAGR